ncbi:hypothetical protein EH228_03210 [Erwinia endophytica]|nr:hypothetical protein EH228_03210 [Erwinia endophytica]
MMPVSIGKRKKVLPVDLIRPDYTRHTERSRCVGSIQSPESLTGVSSSGRLHLPPCGNPNYLGYGVVIPISNVSGRYYACIQ